MHILFSDALPWLITQVHVIPVPIIFIDDQAWAVGMN